MQLLLHPSQTAFPRQCSGSSSSQFSRQPSTVPCSLHAHPPQIRSLSNAATSQLTSVVASNRRCRAPRPCSAAIGLCPVLPAWSVPSLPSHERCCPHLPAPMTLAAVHTCTLRTTTTARGLTGGTEQQSRERAGERQQLSRGAAAKHLQVREPATLLWRLPADPCRCSDAQLISRDATLTWASCCSSR